MDLGAHLDRLCYDGERVVESAAGNEAAIAVTTHRILVVTPDLEGPNLRTYERPNVTDIATVERGPDRWLRAGAKWIVVGVALSIAGLVLDLSGLIGTPPTEGTGAVGLDWIGGVFTLFATAARLFDDLLLFGGLAAVVAGLGLVGWYWARRTETVRLTVAGSEDLHLPAGGLSGQAIEALGTALEAPRADDSNASNG
jgi:hypothetical protein